MNAKDTGKGSGKGKNGKVRKCLCSVHNKMRSADSLIPAGDGTWRCHRETECKDATAQGFKRSLCKFFAQGACQRGEACAFAHGEAELEKMNRVDLADADDSAAREESDSGHVEPREATVEEDFGKTVREWGVEGEDDMDIDQLGAGRGQGSDADEPYLDQGGYGKGKNARAGKGQGKCSVHNKTRSLRCLVDAGDGTWVCQPGMQCRDASAEGVKRSLCKFYLQGMCQRGEACGFAHDESEIGQRFGDEDGFDQATGHGDVYRSALGSGKGKRGSWALGGGRLGPPADSYGPARGKEDFDGKLQCSVHGKPRSASCLIRCGDGSWRCKAGSECRTALDGASTLCRFFLQGTCQRGEGCAFLHDESALPRDDPGTRYRSAPY